MAQNDMDSAKPIFRLRCELKRNPYPYRLITGRMRRPNWVDVAVLQPSGYIVDNSVALDNPGLIKLEISSATVSLLKTLPGGVWTNAGQKQCWGEFFYETA